MESRLKGKVVLITGATAGIGRSTAFGFAKMGCKLILMIRNAEKGEALKKEIQEKYDVDIKLLVVDVRDAKGIEKAVTELPEEWQKISILVNNAGLARGLDKVYMAEIEDIDMVVDTNIKGMLYVIRAVVPLMLKYNMEGHVINLGSIAGTAAYAGGAIYCATKAAVKLLSDGLRIDLVDTPIKVTNIQPGVVETGFSMVRFKGDKERADAVYRGIKALTPDDVADTIIYAANIPHNTQLTEITMTPVHQADGRCIHKVVDLNK